MRSCAIPSSSWVLADFLSPRFIIHAQIPDEPSTENTIARLMSRTGFRPKCCMSSNREVGTDALL